MRIENATVTEISTPDIYTSTETKTLLTSASPVQSSYRSVLDERSYTGLIVGLSVAGAVAFLSFLLACFIKRKYCRPVSVKGRSNGGLQPNDQDMFIVPGSGRSSQISGINPACSFADYVDIDISATIEQPNSLQPGFVAVDLTPASHNSVHESLHQVTEEIVQKAEPQEEYKYAQPSDTDRIKAYKESVVFNVKSRKFSLQEMKQNSSENEKLNKKRNKSLPALQEYNIEYTNCDMQSCSEEVFTENHELESELRRQKTPKDHVIKTKASSLNSVLLEVDAYENIAAIKKQNIASMKEQAVGKEKAQIKVRRAFSEQTRSPVPRTRKARPQKRKTFDPYDYPPGVPVPKDLIDSLHDEDNEYIAHDPFANEDVSAKRKTFDPYDYPPGVPIPKDVHMDTGDSLEIDAEYAAMESPGVYIAYDPKNDKDGSTLNGVSENEYMNYCSKDLGENGLKSDDHQPVTLQNQPALSNGPAPPKPCSMPHYVNELVAVFEEGEHSDKNIGVDKDEDNNFDQSSQDNSNDKDIKITDGDLKKDIYQNISVSENQTEINDNTENDVSVSPEAETAEKGKDTRHDISKSKKNIPATSSAGILRYHSDGCSIYQNLAPQKPPRLHNSVGSLDTDTTNKDFPNTDNQTDGGDLSLDGIKYDSDYEDVLVKRNLAEAKQDNEHGYVNVKRLS